MFHIFDIFFRTTACPVITRATNFPIEVLKQCCIFSEWLEIQDGHYGLWFADTFFFTTCRTTVYELKVVRLVRYVPLELVLKTCYFSERFQKMVLLIWLVKKSPDLYYQKCFSGGSEKLLLLFWCESYFKMAALVSPELLHARSLELREISPEGMLFLFKAFRNPS